MFKEFKEFAMRGNVVDMAVGVVIGGAFGKIVTSLVNDIVMPPLGVLLGNADFSDLMIMLKKGDGALIKDATLNYGMFINNVVNFVIVAFSIFLVIKAMNRITRRNIGTIVPPPK